MVDLKYHNCYSDFVQKNQDEIIHSALKEPIPQPLQDKWILYIACAPFVNFNHDWIRSDLFIPIAAFVDTKIDTYGLNPDDKIYVSALLQQAALMRGQSILIHGDLGRVDVSIHDIQKLKTTFPDYKIAVIYVFDDEIMRLLPQEYTDRGLTKFIASKLDEFTETASRLDGPGDVFIKVKNPVDREKQRSLESITIHPKSGLTPHISNPPDWSDIGNIFPLSHTTDT